MHALGQRSILILANNLNVELLSLLLFSQLHTAD